MVPARFSPQALFRRVRIFANFHLSVFSVLIRLRQERGESWREAGGWEKAARGSDGRTWPWGNEWDFSRCNSGGYEWKGERDGHIYTAPAKSYPEGRSPYGCWNMAGNVAEWVADWYAAESGKSGRGRKAPAGPSRREEKVIKGGGSSSYPSSVRPAARIGHERTFRSFNLGFRCAKDGPPTREHNKE